MTPQPQVQIQKCVRADAAIGINFFWGIVWINCQQASNEPIGGVSNTGMWYSGRSISDQLG